MSSPQLDPWSTNDLLLDPISPGCNSACNTSDRIEIHLKRRVFWTSTFMWVTISSVHYEVMKEICIVPCSSHAGARYSNEMHPQAHSWVGFRGASKSRLSRTWLRGCCSPQRGTPQGGVQECPLQNFFSKLDPGTYLHSAKRRQYTPAKEFFKELRLVLHAYCREAYAIAGTFMVTRQLHKGILRLPDGNRPEDLSLFHSLTWRVR